MPETRSRAPAGVRATCRAVLVAACLAASAASEAAAQDRECTPRRPRVESLRITGNRSISGDTLKSILFTESAGRLRRWFGWNVGPFACLDSTEMRNDARRIARWYELRGYPGTTATVTTERRGPRATAVRFAVREARPIRMDSIAVEGLPARVVDRGALVSALRGRPLDDSLLVQVGDSIREELRAAGYVRAARATHAKVVDSTARRARVTLRFAPGALVRVGAIDVALTSNDPADPAYDEATLRTMLRLAPGDTFLPRVISDAQQRLYTSGIYRSVAIDSVPNAGRGDTIPVQVRLVEGRHHSLRAGGGWGTLDCFRTQARYVEQNFLGRGHRLQLDGRLAKIGTGAPLDGFDALCAPGVRADTFSRKLNYYVGASVALRGVIGERWHPQLTLYSERRTEFQSYLRETTIGSVATVEKPIIPRVSTVFAYRFDEGRTISDQAVACAVFGLCRFNDRVFLTSPSQLHAVGVTFSRSAPAITQFVMNDERWAVETRVGTIHLDDADRRVNFNRTQLEYALYRPLTRGLVAAARVQAGVVLTRRDLESFVPPQERFFSGGQNTVRGFNQNQLGPAVYVVTAFDTVAGPGGDVVGEAQGADGFQRLTPAGGTATALLNLELRTRGGWPIDLLRWAFFVDAGRVWNNTGNYSVSGLRVTPGMGIRVVTPLGPFRVDIGYSPYGYERGPAFFLVDADRTAGTPGRAVCVSPGSTEPLDIARADAVGPVPCPASFLPQRSRTFLSRLAFHFSIGEAF